MCNGWTEDSCRYHCPRRRMNLCKGEHLGNEEWVTTMTDEIRLNTIKTKLYEVSQIIHSIEIGLKRIIQERNDIMDLIDKVEIPNENTNS